MKIVTLMIFLLFSTSCFNRSFNSKIANYLENNCREFPCQMKMSEITDFDWDKMYFFEPQANNAIIYNLLGIYIPEKYSNQRRILFTKKDKVVYYEELPTEIDNYVNNQVNFYPLNSEGYTVISFEDDSLEADKDSIENMNYYQLYSHCIVIQN